jgi:L-threonylcarbamoyladenylate synthase
LERLEAAAFSSDEIAAHAARIIAAGGTIVFPTDTVYGIGCAPDDLAAVERIYAAKGRPREKPLSLHFASVDDVLRFAGNADARVVAFVEAFMPGPVTAIVPRPASLDARVTSGLGSVGLRAPAHALCSAILARTGPLAATSANPSGMPAYIGAGSAVLPDADLLIEAGPTPVGVESTVVDFSQTPARIIRVGAVSRETIEAALGGAFA